MILRYPTFDHDLIIAEDYAHTIVVQSQRLFGRIVQSMIAMEAGELPLETLFFLEDETRLDAQKKLYVVTDPMHIDLNTRRNLTVLYNRMESMLMSEPEKHSEWMRLMIQATEIADDLCRQISCSVRIKNDMSVVNYFKGIELAFSEDFSAEPFDRICSLMDFLAEFMPEKILVLCNTAPYLSEGQRTELLKYGCYLKIPLLCIDTTAPEQLYENEVRWVIRKDFSDDILM